MYKITSVTYLEYLQKGVLKPRPSLGLLLDRGLCVVRATSNKEQLRTLNFKTYVFNILHCFLHYCSTWKCVIKLIIGKLASCRFLTEFRHCRKQRWSIMHRRSMCKINACQCNWINRTRKSFDLRLARFTRLSCTFEILHKLESNMLLCMGSSLMIVQLSQLLGPWEFTIYVGCLPIWKLEIDEDQLDVRHELGESA